MPEFFEDNFQSYRQFVDKGQYTKAVEDAFKLLESRKLANPAQYGMDHKGTPFYVLGYVAFASHDYTSASLYFDAAVAADLIYHTGNSDTAALRFMQLLTTTGEPLLATEIIATMVASMQKLLDDYNKRTGAHPITLDEFRSRFLYKIVTTGNAPERTLVTALLSFVAEWPYRAKQIELVDAGTREPFFLHILRGCVLFESLLKEATGTPRLSTLGRVLDYHKNSLGMVTVDTNEQDFNNIPGSLSPAMTIEDTINSCAKTRNTVGHNLVWNSTSLTPHNYELLVKNVAASCLHAISMLYK